MPEEVKKEEATPAAGATRPLSPSNEEVEVSLFIIISLSLVSVYVVAKERGHLIVTNVRLSVLCMGLTACCQETEKGG